jgi:sec-independent protein translocase protein TatC
MGESGTGGSDVPADEPTVPTDPEPYDPDFDEGIEGPPDDEEQPLAQHIEEMVNRLLVVLAVMALASGVVFPFAEVIINYLWFELLPGTAGQCPVTDPNVACPRVYHPLGLILARLKVATLAGFVVALPVFVYESYLFMRPGLYPKERRYYLASVPTSLILAGVGLLFAHLLVLPAIFNYFLYYSQGAADIGLGLTETFDLIVLMLGFFAVTFQIPLFIMLAIMMGVTTRRWLVDRRLYFWGGFAGIAFIFNPDPTGMAPFIVTATMIALFEGTLGLLYWTGSASPSFNPENVAGLRPYIWGTVAAVGYLASTLPAPRSYYDAIPSAVLDTLAQFDILVYLPVLIAATLILLLEGANYVARARRTRRGYRISRALYRIRLPYWLGAAAVGYFAAPDPPLVEIARDVAFPPVQVAGAILGVIAVFEVTLVVWRWARNRGGDER